MPCCADLVPQWVDVVVVGPVVVNLATSVSAEEVAQQHQALGLNNSGRQPHSSTVRPPCIRHDTPGTAAMLRSLFVSSTQAVLK